MIQNYRDDLEHEKVTAAELACKPYAFIIDKLHRWTNWAAPKKADGSRIAGQVDGARL